MSKSEMVCSFGWSKFIVVVPSIAIREGVRKSFETMQDHFMEYYGKGCPEGHLGLNLGISSGLDKGVDFVGQKTGLSKGPGFTDDMSFADAKRYNQYWDELEKGVHIDHPGLTQADIDAWKISGY